MPRITDDAGQATAEFVATIPAVVLLVLVAVQLAATGYGALSAAVAARTGARAAYVGRDPRSAAVRALPGPLRDEARVLGGDPVTVRVEVPSMLPGAPRVPVSARAALGPEGAGRG